MTPLLSYKSNKRRSNYLIDIRYRIDRFIKRVLVEIFLFLPFKFAFSHCLARVLRTMVWCLKIVIPHIPTQVKASKIRSTTTTTMILRQFSITNTFSVEACAYTLVFLFFSKKK
jgi:hypothetical protein